MIEAQTDAAETALNAEATQREISEEIERCLKGDQSGYEALYNRFAPGIYRLCYSLLLNREDSEDVAQDSFVYAFRNLHRFDVRLASFKTWLYTIAICRCRNMYRKNRVPVIDLSHLLSSTLPAPRSDTPEAALARSSAREALHEALRSLSPRLREAVVLRYGHGLTFREIAEVMECPQKTAESRVRLAHDALRGVLRHAGPGLLEELLSMA
ncbi:sigma-70 family RNA polymerase sigma factor [Anaerolineae bacterium CFX9]|nr:sigma-70 family RNA polymerase sigma factor [Anaerolineae bacterium CFX9]